MGVDNDPDNIFLSAMRAALADGWGGSMIATDASDILFGAPEPIRAKVNLGVLQAGEVNILLHGHVPLLSIIVAAAGSPSRVPGKEGGGGDQPGRYLLYGQRDAHAQGIPVAGSLLQQELAWLRALWIHDHRRSASCPPRPDRLRFHTSWCPRTRGRSSHGTSSW
jgi:carbon-monoxide dehydrogenase catalytic subunit